MLRKNYFSKINFPYLVSEVTGNATWLVEPRMCPDQYVGEINTFCENQVDFPIRVATGKRPNDLKCLIMVIESPHKLEFTGNPGPAKGSTGRLTRKWIKEIRGFSIYDSYGLILINAIQFQCSLGAPTKHFRDEVFKQVWSNGGEDDFIRRLSCIYREGDVITNCCTKGNMKGSDLRRLVQPAIKLTAANCMTHRRTHPSCWFSKKNRAYEWDDV